MINIIKEYVEASQDYENRITKLSEGLAAMGVDNYIVDVIPDLYSSNRDNLLKLAIGDYNFDWLMWYMYEKGDKPGQVWIDEVEFTITNLEDLVSICFEKN